jgi:hypothetical protein
MARCTLGNAQLANPPVETTTQISNFEGQLLDLAGRFL